MNIIKYAFDLPLDKVMETIKTKMSGELKHHYHSTLNDVITCVLVYEKYYVRVDSFVGLTILIQEYDSKVEVVGMTSASGSGLFNIKFGADKNFISKLDMIMKEILKD